MLTCRDSNTVCSDSWWCFFPLCLQVSSGLMGWWSWAWVNRQSWAVGRASRPWSWRSRKPSCASWRLFWKATAHSYDPSPRPPLRKPQTPVRSLTCKVCGIVSLWPKHCLSTCGVLEPNSQVRVTEETGWMDEPSSPLKLLTHKPKQVHLWANFFSLWKKCVWMTIPTKVFTDHRLFALCCFNTSNLKDVFCRSTTNSWERWSWLSAW